MNGKWTIVTGSNAGIGKEIVRALAAKGYPVIMACRNREKAKQACSEITRETGNKEIEVLPLDLASFRSVIDFTERIKTEGFEIRTLINNAGSMNKEYQATRDGFEMTFGVNYLGASLLTKLLLPLLSETEDARIINTTSLTHRIARIDAGIFKANPDKYRRFSAYPASKLAVLLFTLELAERLENSAISVYAADPGVVDTGMISMQSWYDPLTDLVFRPFIKSAERGAETSLFLATAGKKEISGDNKPLLFSGCRSRKVAPSVVNHPYRKQLWRDTELLFLNWHDDLGTIEL